MSFYVVSKRTRSISLLHFQMTKTRITHHIKFNNNYYIIQNEKYELKFRESNKIQIPS